MYTNQGLRVFSHRHGYTLNGIDRLETNYSLGGNSYVPPLYFAECSLYLD